MTKTKTTKNSRTKTITKATKTEAKVKAPRTPKAPSVYSGAAIAASKVYRRDMPEFKNCKAECWMLVNEVAGTTTFANTYNGLLKASYDAKTYTYKTNPKKLAKKTETMEQIEFPGDWPTWITSAAGEKKVTHNAATHPGKFLDEIIKGSPKLKAIGKRLKANTK